METIGYFSFVLDLKTNKINIFINILIIKEKENLTLNQTNRLIVHNNLFLRRLSISLTD